MSTQRLTDLTIKNLRPKARPYDKKDVEVRGLHVRVLPSGHKSFVLLTRFPGSNNPTRRALGEYGVMSLEEARDKARAWRKKVANSIDPSIEQQRERQAAQQRNGLTVAAVAADYFANIGSQRRAREVERDLRKLIDQAGWARRPIHDITALDVRDALRPYQGKVFHSTNLFSYVRRLFNWAVDQGCYGIEASPCDRLKPKRIIGTRTPRDRVLLDQEIRAVWLAANNMPHPWGPMFRLLLLLGQRRTEVSEMRWSEIDLTAKTWTIPASRMKAGAAHIVPLPDDAVTILQSLPRFEGDYVFSTNGGRTPVRGHSHAKHALDAEIAKVLGQPPAPFVIHDLRRTMRTRLSAIPNISDLVRELVIGHTKPGLHKVYDQYAYLDEKRFALEAWAAKLRSIINPSPANVVELRAAQ
jgi:integrase